MSHWTDSHGNESHSPGCPTEPLINKWADDWDGEPCCEVQKKCKQEIDEEMERNRIYELGF